MNLEVQIIGAERPFHALSDEWDGLVKSAPRATPFQSWPWLSSWWEAFGAPRALRVITVRRHGELVGALPLMLDRRPGRARLEFIGTGLSDHLDGLAVDGLEDEVVHGWTRGLQALRGWTVADLQEVRASAVVWRLMDRWSPATAVEQSLCSERRAEPWSEFLAPMSRNARGQMRRSVRTAAADGVVARPVTGVEVPAAVDGLIEGHRAQWAARAQDITGEHLTDRFRAFLRCAVAGMVERDEASLIEFRDDLGVLARVLFVTGHDYVGDYLYSADPRALETYSVNALTVHAALEIAETRGLPTLCFLRGDEPWKRRWAPDLQHNHRIVLGRSRTSWAVHAGYRHGRATAAAYLASDASPAWLTTAVERLRSST